jgi:hypothetical protein
MTLYRLAPLAALSVALVACNDDDNGTEPQQTALVRVVNASPSTPTADLFVGGQSTALAAGTATGSAAASCALVPADNQTLSFRQGGNATTIASAIPFTFASGQQYTIILTGSGTTTGARNAVVLTDDATITAPATGQNALRFFNATGTTGNVNVYVTAPGAALGTASQTGLASNAATTGGTGGYSTYPTTSTQVRVFPTGSATTGTPIVNFTIPTLSGTRIATVVLTGGTSGAQAFVVTPCS